MDARLTWVWVVVRAVQACAALPWVVAVGSWHWEDWRWLVVVLAVGMGCRADWRRRLVELLPTAGIVCTRSRRLRCTYPT